MNDCREPEHKAAILERNYGWKKGKNVTKL
jgi:hypothetical protein